MSKLDKYKNYSTHQKRLKYRTDKEDNMSVIHFLMVSFYFVSLFFLFYYFKRTFIDLLALCCIYLLLASAAFMVPISLYRKKFTMSFYEFAFLNMIGIAPLLSVLFLLLNFHLASGEYVEKYKISKRFVENKNLVLVLENDALEDQEFLRTIDQEKMYSQPLKISDTLYLTLADGLFGYKVLKSRNY